MSRKLIIIIVISIIVVFGAWIYKASQNTTNPDGTKSTSILGSLFPFGGGNPKTPASGTTGGETPATGEPGAEQPQNTLSERITLVSNKLIAGYTVLPSPTIDAVPEYSINDDSNASKQILTQLPIVRFAEKGTGYLYDINAHGENGKKVSGTVIARTAEAIFGDNGESVILRYIKDDNQTIASFLGHVVPSTLTSLNDGTLKGDFLPDEIPAVTISPDQKNFLFLLPTANGVAGISMKTDGTAKKQLFKSSFSEWLLDWPSTGPVLTTKANADTPGYTYLVTTSGTSSGVFQKILGSINGLTTKMSPDGKALLYSVSGGNGFGLHLLRLKEGIDINLGLQTFPEKCTWTPDSAVIYCAVPEAPARLSYPDAWYQGSTHFRDTFWKIDAVIGTTTSINNGEGKVLDATNLAVDDHVRYLFFINKNEGSLWSLDFTPPKTITPALPEHN